MTPSFLSRIFPKPYQFQDFLGNTQESLPARAMPFIWYFVKKLKWALGVQVLTNGTGSALIALEPWFFGLFVQAVTDSTSATVWANVLPVIAGYIFFAQILVRVNWQVSHVIETYTSPTLLTLVRQRLATYLYNHSYRFFQEDFAGRLAGKVVEMPSAVLGIVTDIADYALHTALSIIVTLILFSLIDWRLSLLAFVTIALHAVLSFWRTPHISQAAAVSAAASHKMRGRYIDSISNILLVKLFSRRSFEEKQFAQELIAAGETLHKENWQHMLYLGAQNFLRAVFQAGVITLCAYGYYIGEMSVGDVATALPLSLLVTTHLWWFMQNAPQLFSRLASIQESLDTIIQEQEVKDAPGAGVLAVKTPTLNMRDITFAYGHQHVFKDFSLQIPARQKLGLVGPSGAGKSTLVQLVLRLFDLQGGKITIDGTDIATVSQDSLREAISVIPQSTDLLHRSILENIRYGRPEASMDEVIDAAKKAHIHDVILKLKDQHDNTGYDAMVGERGVKLSGGQRQRIAIARAFLKNSPILIMDEPTSALDSESEKLIQKSLATLMEGRTVIAIAHRLSTILHLDRIVVMQEGRIVEDGVHGNLLVQDGLYARLWALQSEGFIGEAISPING